VSERNNAFALPTAFGGAADELSPRYWRPSNRLDIAAVDRLAFAYAGHGAFLKVRCQSDDLGPHASVCIPDSFSSASLTNA
jgi:hypothetical protein